MMVRAFQGVLCVNKPIYMVCYKALCDVGQFYLFFILVRLHVCSLQMTDRTNRHNSTNRGSMGGIENLGEFDGGGIGNFLVVGAVGSSMGEIWKEWGNVLGCGGR